MNSIITHLILYNQYLLKQISQLLLFIAKYIPLKQWAFDDSHSPEYQKFKVDKLPKIFVSEPIDYEFLLAYYQHKYGKTVKQIVERLNRTFKYSYRVTCGYGSENGSLYGVSLWVAYYNFLRPHPYNYWRPLNTLDAFKHADNMPAKWQMLILLGQKTILDMQKKQVV